MRKNDGIVTECEFLISKVASRARAASLAALGRTTRWREALERARSQLGPAPADTDSSSDVFAARALSALAESAVVDGDFAAALGVMSDARFHRDHSPLRNYQAAAHHEIVDPVVHRSGDSFRVVNTISRLRLHLPTAKYKVKNNRLFFDYSGHFDRLYQLNVLC